MRLILFGAVCWLQNRLLAHDVSRLSRRRDIGRAVELRALIRRLGTYADAIDADISD